MLFILEKFEGTIFIFIFIHFYIQKALIGISSDIYFSDEEFYLFTSITAAITPVKITVSRKDANLLRLTFL